MINGWMDVIQTILSLFLFFQIIYKLKKHNDAAHTVNTEDICDRIFELVDKNHDSKSFSFGYTSAQLYLIKRFLTHLQCCNKYYKGIVRTG